MVGKEVKVGVEDSAVGVGALETEAVGAVVDSEEGVETEGLASSGVDLAVPLRTRKSVLVMTERCQRFLG